MFLLALVSDAVLRLRSPRLARLAGLAVLCAFAAGCSPRVTAPFRIEAPRVGSPASISAETLRALPDPREKVVVAVYRFRDQTGQYRALENVSTFSTAVTQGATTILMRALDDSGWFVPIEREGLSNLLNERQIITSTRQQYTGPDGEALAPLPPLLYAGVLLEGGIIGYDTNLITGGSGLRFLGAGGSGQFRQDQVTIYLRAVSTQNGRVLKTVHVTKTILSQRLDGGLFRFVELRQLLEAEAGYSTNEPPVLAVTAAIEEAVAALVVEGVRDQLWELANAGDGPAMFAAYQARVAEDARRDTYDRLLAFRRPRGVQLDVGAGLGRVESDFASPTALPVGTLAVRLPVGGGGLSLGVAGRGGLLDAGVENRFFVGGEATARGLFFPSARISPFLALGGGVLGVPDNPSGETVFPYATASAGVESRLGPSTALWLGISNLYPLREGLDGVRSTGGVNDNVWSVRGGLTLYTR